MGYHAKKLNKITVVLLAGKAGSGKDTMANYLVDNYSFKKFAFADELKKYVAKKYSINHNLLFSQIGKKTSLKINNKELTLRDLLIKEALEKKSHDENHWVNIVIEKLISLNKSTLKEESNNRIVISDFRFPNEFYEIYKICDKVLTVNIIRDKGSENIDDISEKSLNNFHFDNIIINNGYVENLYKNIDNYILSLKINE